MASQQQQPGIIVPGSEIDCPIKMFVGQVPKHYDEEALRPYFQSFGEIVSISIIKDLSTGFSKGAAFVTFLHQQNGLDCAAALNERTVLPGSMNVIVVRPADGVADKGEDRKLFVGMLHFHTTEEYLRDLFSRYGQVIEVSLLRLPDGTPRGCAFVRFANREQCQNAINGLHEKMTIEGVRGPLQVRFADSGQRKQQQHQQQFAQPFPDMQSYAQNPALMAPLLSLLGLNPQVVQQLQMQQQQFGGQPMMGYGGQPVLSAALSGVQQFNAAGYGQQPYAQQNSFGAIPGRVGRPGTGPEGANLFILGLAPEVNDEMLKLMFAPFGNVISANVFLDKITRMSRQFGFVSYDNTTSAAAAVASMNGYNHNGHILKVSIKKSQTPY